MVAVVTENITKAYRFIYALRNVSIKAEFGKITVIFGSNGAGKSTLLRTILGLVRPDSGQTFINGLDTQNYGPQVRAIVGASLHSSMLYQDLTVMENLMFAAKLFRLSNSREACISAAQKTEVQDFLNKKVRYLSRGLHQRVSISKAILHQPKILILDEPQTGLDPKSVELLDKILNHQKQSGYATLMATHVVSKGLAISDSVIVMHNGRVVTQTESSNVDIKHIYKSVA